MERDDFRHYGMQRAKASVHSMRALAIQVEDDGSAQHGVIR